VSADAQIDYDALAKQHGAIETAAPVDYDALAKQHGAVSSEPAQATDRSGPAYWDQLKDKYGLPRSVDLSKTLVNNFGRIPKEGVPPRNGRRNLEPNV